MLPHTVLGQQKNTNPAGASAILLRSGYLDLSYPFNVSKQIALYGIPGGEGQLVFYRGVCVLNPFGDTFRCNNWGAVVCNVSLPKNNTTDPRGEGRLLYDIMILETSDKNFQLEGTLRLITPSDPGSGSYRIFYEGQGLQKPIPCERVKSQAVQQFGPGGIPIIDLASERGNSTSLDFDKVDLVGPFDGVSYFLTVSGTSPNLNMKIDLLPRLNLGRPEYREIDVVGSLDDRERYSAKGPYVVTIPLKHSMGKLGVEVFGKTKHDKVHIPAK